MDPLETRLTAVTVYPDRARLTRSGKVTLEAGVQTVQIANLPSQLNPESVRAAARGSARARLTSVQVGKAFYTEAPVEQARELELRIEVLLEEISALEGRAALVKGQRLNLEAIGGHTETYAAAMAAGELDVEAGLAVLDGLRARAEALDGDLRDIGREKRELNKQLAALKNELEQIRAARPRQRYSTFIELEVLEPGDLTVELVYVVLGADWKPLYDLRFSEVEGDAQLELGYLAQVEQHSGEIWEGVELTLSTARPALGGGLPEPKPWFISPPRPLPPPARPTPMVARGEKMVAAAAMPAPQAEAAFEAEEVIAAVVDTGAGVSYTIPGSTTVPGDGSPRKVVIARLAFKPELDYASAPRHVQAVYRRASVENASRYLILPGEANLFDGDEYIGELQLELTPPQGEIELSLGIEDRIEIERELARRDVDKTLIGGKRRVRYAYEIEIKNRLSRDVKLTLHDQIPVARHEEIKVRLESCDPKPSQHDELNLLEWELTLGANSKRQVRYDFSVEYPRDMDLLGLP